MIGSVELRRARYDEPEATRLTLAAQGYYASIYGGEDTSPIDADEFLRIPSRPMLERALAELPPGHYGQIAWPTFVPPLAGRSRDILEVLRASRRAACRR